MSVHTRTQKEIDAEEAKRQKAFDSTTVGKLLSKISALEAELRYRRKIMSQLKPETITKLAIKAGIIVDDPTKEKEVENAAKENTGAPGSGNTGVFESGNTRDNNA